MTVTITGSSGVETAQTGDSDITLDAGTGSQAGNQASTVNLKLNGTLKGDISVDEARSGNPLELNTTSAGNVVLAMGGGNVGIGAAAPGEKLTVVGDMSVDTDTLYVDSTNNRVGIGTSSPTSKLQIRQGSNSNTAGIRVDENTAGNVYGALSASGTNTITLTAGSASSDSTTLRFLTASSGTEAEAMRIDSSGLIGINSSSTSSAGYVARLYINDTRTGSSESVLSLRHGSTGSNRPQIVFMNPNGAVGSVTTSGSATAYNTSSDYRLKENVVDLTGASDRVNQIPVHRFNFIADPDTTVDGFLAHEVQSVVPEAVTGTKDAMRDEEYEVTPAVLDDDGNVVTEAVMGTRSVPDHQGIDQSKLVPLLTAALQEALSEIADLKTRVAALETP